jgi:hypothetical protein
MNPNLLWCMESLRIDKHVACNCSRAMFIGKPNCSRSRISLSYWKAFIMIAIAGAIAVGCSGMWFKPYARANFRSLC